MEKKFINDENEFASFFGGENIDIVDADIVEESPVEQTQEVENKEQGFQPISEELDIIEEDVEEAEKQEQEEQDSVKAVDLYKGVAKTFAAKFGLDFDENSVNTLDELADFADAFSDYVAEAKIESYKNTNEELKTLIDIAENGGNLKELSKLYTERQEILEHDISTEEGQAEIVKQYYKSIGKTDEWVKKHVARLKSDEELHTEAEEVKETFQLKKKEEADKKALMEQKEIKRKEEEKIAKVNNLGNSFIKSGLSQKGAAAAVDFVYKEAYKSKDGTLLTEFDKKIIDVKNSPEELLELIQFLNNKEKYLQLKLSKETTKKTETTFANILKNQVNRKVGSVQEMESKEKKVKALTLTDFIKT